jgi:hypothetical protein
MAKMAKIMAANSYQRMRKGRETTRKMALLSIANGGMVRRQWQSNGVSINIRNNSTPCCGVGCMCMRLVYEETWRNDAESERRNGGFSERNSEEGENVSEKAVKAWQPASLAAMAERRNGNESNNLGEENLL